jgi:hypothetical protein
MPSVTLNLTADGETSTNALDVNEKFQMTILLAGNASDTSITLGSITNAKYIVVIGARGISFKLGSGGSDDIGADPFGVVSDEYGLGENIVLLSNSRPSEQSVIVMAGE